jgi:tetratricopeptide (TPR) repeat protein
MLNNAMKFAELVALVEAKGTKPGERYKSSMDAEGPKGIASSPIGKSNYNPEKRVADSRWDFDPTQIGDVGKLQGSQVWNTFKNAFGLLMNNGMFKPRLGKIIEKFNQQRQSLNLEDEKKLDNLYAMEVKMAGKIEGIKADLKIRQQMIRHYDMPRRDKEELEIEISKLSSGLETAKKILSKERSGWSLTAVSEVTNKLKDIDRLNSIIADERAKPTPKIDKIKKSQQELNAIEKSLRSPKLAIVRKKMDIISKESEKLDKMKEKMDHANMTPRQIDQVKSVTYDLRDDLDKAQKMYDKIKEELDELTASVANIGPLNQEANDEAIAALKKDVLYYADLILSNMEKDTPQNLKNFSEVNWEEIGAGRVEQIAALRALTRDDSTNPIFGYLERFQRAYDNQEFDVGRALNKNVNISTVRDFENLPFYTFSRIYKFMLNAGALNKQAISEIDETSPLHQQGLNEIDEIVSGNETSKDAASAGLIRTKWADEVTKEALKSAVSKLQIPDKQKSGLYVDISAPFNVNRGGKTSFFMFKSRVDAAIRDAKRSIYKESFDEFAARILQSTEFDEIDYKLDLMEIIEESSKKCTGPTKKASSDRKGKKWTKCAKQPDGSYKRIHWGEAGVRVTGKSGNTKRKKSFKSRHSCDKAKPGSANALSCSDWE